MGRYGFDAMDVKIVAGLNKYTPRKIHKISQVLNIPESTLRHRINRMLRLGLLKMSINPRYDYLGMLTAVLHIKYNPKHVDRLVSSLKENPYALCIQKIYGVKPEIFVFYAVPIESKKYLVYYMDKMLEMGLAYDYKLFWMTFLKRVKMDSKWFDGRSKQWKFDWRKLYEKFLSEREKYIKEGVELSLEEKVYNKIKDMYDIRLLEAMEEMGDISLSDLSQKLNTTVQNLHYHFHRHILGEDLVEAYIMHFAKYLNTPVLYPVVYIDFEKADMREILTRTVDDLYALEFIGYVLGGNKVIQIGAMPISTFLGYVEFLDRILADGFIKKYKFYFLEKNLLDCKKKLPYHLYKRGGWTYENEKYIMSLERSGSK